MVLSSLNLGFCAQNRTILIYLNVDFNFDGSFYDKFRWINICAWLLLLLSDRSQNTIKKSQMCTFRSKFWIQRTCESAFYYHRQSVFLEHWLRSNLLADQHIWSPNHCVFILSSISTIDNAKSFPKNFKHTNVLNSFLARYKKPLSFFIHFFHPKKSGFCDDMIYVRQRFKNPAFWLCGTTFWVNRRVWFDLVSVASDENFSNILSSV